MTSAQNAIHGCPLLTGRRPAMFQMQRLPSGPRIDSHCAMCQTKLDFRFMWNGLRNLNDHVSTVIVNCFGRVYACQALQ